MTPTRARSAARRDAKQVRALAEALEGLAGQAFRRGDRTISMSAASALSVLERTGPKSVTELAAREGVTQPTMTDLISGLQRAGLVTRRRREDDRRVVLVELSDAGAEYLYRRRSRGTEAFAELLAKLPDDDISALLPAVEALGHLRDLDRGERS